MTQLPTAIPILQATMSPPTEIQRLENAMKDEIRAIVKTSSALQDEVKRHLQWLQDKQTADVEVCKIRFERAREQLLKEESGETISPGPIRKLPFELIGYIFRYHVDSGQSPWELVKVCKDWMSIAMRTPHIWRHICVTTDDSLYNKTTRKFVVDGEFRLSRGNKQVCRTMSQLLGALCRSGAVPLYITFEFEKSVTNHHLQLISTIFTSPVCERLGSLGLNTLFLPKEILLPELSVGRFPLLTEIYLPVTLTAWIYTILESVSLTSAILETADLAGGVTLELINLSFWAHLKKLRIHRDTELFDRISAKLLELEDFSDCLRGWPGDGTPMLTWANIRRIRISCRPDHLSRLCLPNLECLVFIDVRHRAVTELLDNHIQISYPRLTKLKITTCELRWLSELSVPLVEDLDLEYNKGDPFLPSLVGIFSTLRVLNLATDCGGDLTVELLSCFPEIDTLCLSGEYKELDFGLQLLTRLGDSSQPLFCPNLTKLSLGTIDSRVYTTKKKAGSLIKRVISFRKKSHRPLLEFSIFWSKCLSDPEQYVQHS